MALGTVTVPSPRSGDFAAGNRKVRTRVVQITSGANYTTGGETITPVNVGLRQRIDAVMGGGSARLTTDGSTSIPVSVIPQANGSVKIQGYVAATGAEQASNANLSTFSIRLTFIGY